MPITPIDYQKLPLPANASDILQFGQLIHSSLSLISAEIINQYDHGVILVTKDMQQSLHMAEEIKQFTDKPVSILDDWETLPYDNFSPHTNIISQRLSCLFQLPYHQEGVLLLPINTLMQKVCPHEFIAGHIFIMKKGLHIDRERFRIQLETAGYRSVNRVMAHGEFATRGALFDLFPMGSDSPYRIDFFDNEIDSIRTFDIETQRTLTQIDEIRLLPAHEFPTNNQAIEIFRSQWRELFDVRRDEEYIYQQVSKGILPPGIEYWQPLFFTQPLTPLFAYFPANSLILTVDEIDQYALRFWQDTMQRYESRRHDLMRPLLPPEQIWLRTEELFQRLKQYPRINLSSKKLSNRKQHYNFDYQVLPELAIQVNHKIPFHLLEAFLTSQKSTIIFSVESEGRKETLLALLNKIDISPTIIHCLSDISKTDHYIMIGACEQGFIDNRRHHIFITENDLFGKHTTHNRRKDHRRIINTDMLIRNLAELHLGQPIVHLDHGVGRYMGLTTLETGGITAEYLVLHYANDAKLYVPVSSLHLINRYLGGEEENAPLHKLGTETWNKAKLKAAEKIRDTAAELLDIYAQRQMKNGVSFKQDQTLYQEFNQGFPYELTPDQRDTIAAVISDMCSEIAMDRLVCGDVGFGKTEVAIRAAFLAVLNKKQVAILVPTTLLAQQHYENFKDRFAGWPVQIDMISRFRTQKEQRQILTHLESGQIDILIGTHKLLQQNLQWHDLGLLIVDEEHRFGVRQKERIKAMRANIDILTLTATPIPRTLNMAMHSIRDLSLITTPPPRRLAVKTFVREYDELVIREAILREILRGGQVYYLFNDVAHIESAQTRIAEMVPEARVAIGHGQMHERDLERVMNDFHHQRFNVLVCSTIIETGIDIPAANTIIIERADKFGLAQLHQLRGRVGRSHHQAYAYLITPPIKLISSDARKRLDAIASLEDLGAGFALATHDLEIRGAGELLGDDQSGQIETIGFSLYMELLENAVTTLKSGKEPSLDDLINRSQTEIELKLPTLLPDTFIPDVNTRLSFYKRIASSKNRTELDELQVELIDRFGLLPEPVKFLFSVTQFRQRAEALGIKRIELNGKSGFIQFSRQSNIDINFLIGLIQKQPTYYKLEGADKLKISRSLTERIERIKFIDELLTRFEQHRQPN